MSTTSTSAPGARPHVSTTLRRWGFGGLAVAWYAVTTFVPLGLPNFVVVLVPRPARHALGRARLPVPGPRRRPVPAGTSSWPSWRWPRSSRSPSGWTCCSAGSRSSPGTLVLATCAAVCVALPRLAQTRERPRPAVLGHRELIISVTALVASSARTRRASCSSPMVAFAVLAPVVMAVRRVRLGGGAPRRLARGTWALQAGNLWLFLALLGAAGLTGTFFVWRIYTPDAEAFVVAAFWVGLAADRRPGRLPPPTHLRGDQRPGRARLGLPRRPARRHRHRAAGRGHDRPPVHRASGRSSPAAGARWSTTTGRSPCSVTRSTSSRSSTARPTAATGAGWRTSTSSATRCSPSRTAASPRPSTATPTCPSAGTPGTTWPATT